MRVFEPLVEAKHFAVRAVLDAAKTLAKEKGVDASSLDQLWTSLLKASSHPKFVRGGPDRGDLGVNCAMFAKTLRQKPASISKSLCETLKQISSSDWSSFVTKYEDDGAYLNFWFSSTVMSSIVPLILTKGFTDPVVLDNAQRVMIEYSQPNTHKAFHVGHMRNAALGDALVRLYEYVGNDVVAANYFGDEGAHVAKCLWRLQTQLEEQKKPLEQLPKPGEHLGEFLGALYAEAADMLDLSTLTEFPYPGVISAKVLAVGKHPKEDAPKNWNVVKLDIGSNHVNVVCGATGFTEGDNVPYTPVGGRINRNEVIPKDMKGVLSEGVILAMDEMGLSGGQKKQVLLLPKDSRPGTELPELGRKDGVENVMVTFNKRKEEAGKVLAALESRDPEAIELWEKTRLWSLDAFKEIYEWLGCRFDHDFFESQVGDESKHLVMEYLEKGVLQRSDGAIGADLSEFNLPFCLLLKSDGTGLYATKDLSLAHRKFTEFNIDKSIYIVDAAQTLHFQQVFAVLLKMGYEKAQNCFHLAYGQVRLPSGKMSSRKGNVVFFSHLKDQLGNQIRTDFLDRHQGDWSMEEIEKAEQVLSVATIKYGMLNVDPARDIVFEMEKWAAKSGETGVYLMYGYTRCKSILRKVEYPDVPFNEMKLGGDALERSILLKLNNYWFTVNEAVKQNRPSLVTTFMFELTQMFMSWYEVNIIKDEVDLERKRAQLDLVRTIACVLATGMNLMGIQTIERM